MSLFDAADRLAAIDHSAIELDAARCLHSLDRNSACDACFDVCPVHAITAGKPPTLDPAKCESCLACLPACPVGAFSADDAVQSLLNAAAHVESPVLELVCDKNPNPEKGQSEKSTGLLIKGCLAGLGTGAYTALAPFGFERVVCRVEACAACPWSSLRPKIEEDVARARDVLAVWDKPESISVSSADATVERPIWNAANPPLSRRDLFRMVARQGQVAMARAMENGVRAAGRRPGRDRLRFIGAAAHLPAPKEDADVRLGMLDFATISVTEACSACGACARACPTEAVKFEKDEEETKFGLKFSPPLCIGCGLCTRVCVPLAITVDHDPSIAAVFASQQVPLIEGELVKCKRCGALTAKRGDEQLCDLCEFRQAHPFGSKLPPGFKLGPSGLKKES